MSVGASCFIFGLTNRSSTVGFLLLQHFSYSRLLRPHCCFISVFVWFVFPELFLWWLEIRQKPWLGSRLRKNDLTPTPVKKILTFPRLFRCRGFNCWSSSLRTCAAVFFYFDSRLAIFWQSDWFPLLKFLLWRHVFVSASFPLVSWMRICDNCIASWSLSYQTEFAWVKI